MDRQFNGYPISYLKAYLRKINTWPLSTKREYRILALRSLTVFKHTGLNSAFRQAWGLPKKT